MTAPAPLIDATAARLQAEVPELGTVRRAAELASLLRSNAGPQTEAACFLLASGMDAAAPARATGAHDQDVTRLLTVVLILRGSTPTGDRLMDDMEALKGRILTALAGWVPPGAMYDPFAFRRERTQPGTPGTFVVQFDFASRDRLRVFT